MSWMRLSLILVKSRVKPYQNWAMSQNTPLITSVMKTPTFLLALLKMCNVNNFNVLDASVADLG
jgi:hypothetical protein